MLQQLIGQGVLCTYFDPCDPRVVVLVVMWTLFAVLVYNVVTLERDYTEYDPFAILELDTVSEGRRE